MRLASFNSADLQEAIGSERVEVDVVGDGGELGDAGPRFCCHICNLQSDELADVGGLELGEIGRYRNLSVIIELHLCQIAILFDLPFFIIMGLMKHWPCRGLWLALKYSRSHSR